MLFTELKDCLFFSRLHYIMLLVLLELQPWILKSMKSCTYITLVYHHP